MKIIVFDSNPPRSKFHCEAISRVKPDAEIWRVMDGEVTSFGFTACGAPEQFDLGFLHDNPTDQRGWNEIQISMQVLYCGSGCTKDCGVPRVVSESNPLQDEEIRDVLAAFEAGDRSTFAEAITAIWSGVPQHLLAWVLQKTYGQGEPHVGLFATAEREYSIGRKQVLAKTGNDGKEAIEARLQQRFSLEGAKALIAELRADL